MNSRPEKPWWHDAVVYEVYIRSFADGNGDGIGDIAGVRSRLPYLRDLGVDALWFTPWYDSPWVDGGYDVADYRRINRDFGSVHDAEALIAEAAALGIRTIVDVVPNHVSTQHPWFQEALAAGPGSAARERFWFRASETVPTKWPSSFSGEAWNRTGEQPDAPGEWYLHLFDSAQPDLNWNNQEVRDEFQDVLRFWFDRGVGGIRIDSAAMLVKDPALPEIEDSDEHPFLDRTENHDIYRSWRAVADEYGDRALVGEVWLADLDRFADYLRPDEMHMAFNFDFMTRPWNASSLRESIVETLDTHVRVGAPPTWVLSNHDVTRPVTRYGRNDSAFSFDAKRFDVPTDLELGQKRARAAAMLIAALPGVLYIYQGDELGLPEVEDLPLDVRTDPMFLRSEGRDPGRDGCRVPLPWSSEGDAFGFSPAGASGEPWLPQPAGWGQWSVASESADPDSTLSLYRAMLRLRRELSDVSADAFSWLPSPQDVLVFRRGDVVCATNMSPVAWRVPGDAVVLLASSPLSDGCLPPSSSVWFRSAATAF